MLENPKVTVTKLSEILGVSTTAVENNIQYLKAHGYVKRHGPAKGGNWEVLGLDIDKSAINPTSGELT